jgi:GTPase
MFPNTDAKNNSRKSLIQKGTALPPEVDSHGNIEYKRHLINPSRERFQHLATQLKWRLTEGYGEAMYELGIYKTYAYNRHI